VQIDGEPAEDLAAGVERASVYGACRRSDAGSKGWYHIGMRFEKTTRLLLAVALLTITVFLPASSFGQTRSARDTGTAYGARLNAKGQPADLNPARIQNRIQSRINNRLDLRIERYRPAISGDPTAAFQTMMNDKTRAVPVISPSQQINIDDTAR
jgi:hypothetical protein